MQNVDAAIFIVFLAVTFLLGLYSSRGITTIKEYAIGDRNFSTPTIVATLIATWISGEFFYSNIYETYNLGLNAIWIASGDFLYLLIIGVFFAPRMGEFLGKLSIAEAMGDLYGKRIRVITAISGIIGAAGVIAIQLKMTGAIFEYALELPSSYGIISAAIIVIIYSSLGGIKSVTFTDVIQFFTFGIVIPLIAYVLFTSIENFDIVIKTLGTSPLYDYDNVFDFSQSLPFKQLFLFLLFIVPVFSPATFQRVAMAKNTIQVGKSFVIAAFVCLMLLIIVNWIAILIFTVNPSYNTSDIIGYIVFNSSYPGLKGAILVGVMAMIMSTIDSYLNSTAVLVVHDFCEPLKIKFIKNELFTARIASILIGILALVLSLREGNSLQELLVITLSFYEPIIVPFTMAVLGFRTSEKSVLLGMAAGLTTVLIWDYVLGIEVVNSAFFGIIVNLVTLIGSHYLLRQKGGWVGIKDKIPLINIRNERKLRLRMLVSDLKSFNIIDVCKKNYPKGEGLIAILGIFCMISAFASIHTLAREYQIQYKYLIDILYPMTLFVSTALISYPLWLQNWKDGKLIGVVYNIAIFSVLICFSLLMVLISQFSEIQLMVFMVNIIILSLTITWRWALFTIIFGAVITSFFYNQYLQENLLGSSVSMQFKIVYLLLLLSATIIVFLKPQQEHLEATENRANDLEIDNKALKRELGHATREIQNLNDGLMYLSKEFDKKENTVTQKGRELNSTVKELKQQLGQMQQAMANMKNMDDMEKIKEEFFRNLQHETNAPLTSIISKSDVLYDAYDTLDKAVIKETVKEIIAGSDRLKTYVNNLVDTSNLTKAAGATLDQVHKINLSNLVKERTVLYKKTFSDDKHQAKFKLNIEPNLMVECNEHYIIQLLDNLISNADKYGNNSVIEISLKKMNSIMVEFKITDHGIGIPKKDLYNIFKSFTTSSKTHTQAGGRGLGLALCQKVIDAHQGKILVESDAENGTTFMFVIPFNYHYKG